MITPGKRFRIVHEHTTPSGKTVRTYVDTWDHGDSAETFAAEGNARLQADPTTAGERVVVEEIDA